MTNNTELFIEKLNELRMTPEERKLKKAEELGEQVMVGIVALLIIPTMIWMVLTFIFAMNIAWVKVFGAYFLFNLFKNILVKSFKK